MTYSILPLSKRPKPRSLGKVKTVNNAKYSWISTASIGSINDDVEVFAHNAKGQGVLRSSSEKQLREYERSLQTGALFKKEAQKSGSFLDQTFATGYVGVRFGQQIRKEDPLLAKAQSYGILGEFRSGILKGLRIYYDVVPEVNYVFDGLETRMSSNRLVIGSAFWFRSRDL